MRANGELGPFNSLNADLCFVFFFLGGGYFGRYALAKSLVASRPFPTPYVSTTVMRNVNAADCAQLHVLPLPLFFVKNTLNIHSPPRPLPHTACPHAQSVTARTLRTYPGSRARNLPLRFFVTFFFDSIFSLCLGPPPSASEPSHNEKKG